jgi:hypothetical protein
MLLPLVGKFIIGFRWKSFAGDLKQSLLKSPPRIIALFGYFDSINSNEFLRYSFIEILLASGG